MVEPIERKKIEATIRNSLKRGTKFLLFDGLEYKASSNVVETREEQVEFRVACGEYCSLQDYFILHAVNSLGVATIPIIVRRLGIEKKRFPEKEIPVLISQGALKRRLNVLTKNGLLFCHEYVDKEGSFDREHQFVKI